MADNHLAKACISTEREALVFWSPQNASWNGLTPKTTPRLNGTVQIIDVFSLEVATGYSRDPNGRLLLHSKPSIAEGRSWSLAKAAQLIRNDAHPHRWVAQHKNNRAWGMFWAGGGLQLCREQLAAQVDQAEAGSELVPVSAERVLDLVLSNERSSSSHGPLQGGLPQQQIFQWVALTSALWLVILAVICGGFLHQLERQNRKLDALLERLEARDIKP